MVVSLIRRSKFYQTDCLSEPPTLSFKEPHAATTLRLFPFLGLTQRRMRRDCSSFIVPSTTVFAGTASRGNCPVGATTILPHSSEGGGGAQEGGGRGEEGGGGKREEGM